MTKDINHLINLLKIKTMRNKLKIAILLIMINASFEQGYAQANYSAGCVASDPLNTSALGYNSQGLGNNSFAAGYQSIANGLNSSAIGENCFSGSQSYAIGQNAKATANNSFAFGRFVETAGYGPGSIVIGCSNTASGILVNNISNSLMIGFSSSPILFANQTKVGIATTSPLYTFDVNGTSLFRNDVRIVPLISARGKRVVITDEEGRLSFTEDFVDIPGDNLGNHIAGKSLNIQNYSIYNGSIPADQSYVGLSLTKENNAFLTNGSDATFTIISGTAKRSSLWLTNDVKGGFALIANSNNASAGIYYDISNPQPIINFTANKVGIGIEPVASSKYSLFVKGGIITEELLIKLESSGWYDEVFDENYTLLSLKEVEAYVRENRHLPDIPSAEEVGKNGLEIGEFNALLLKKVEELTLYAIEQQKKIDALQTAVNNLNK